MISSLFSFFDVSALPPVVLYIDPGTGSMLFTILLAVIGSAFYSLRLLFMKLRFRLSGGMAEADKDLHELAIFSDDKRYWTVFEPICAELARRGQKVTYLTADKNDPALAYDNAFVKAAFLGEGNKAFAKLNLLRARVLLSTTPGLDVFQWKRSKQVRYYVHIPHAASEVVLYRMFGLDYYDGVLLSGQFQADDIRALEALRHLPAKDLCLTGIPYMDVMKQRLTDAPAIASTKKTILVAPSWGEQALFAIHGEAILARLLETDYQIIVRPHPHSFIVEKERLDKLMAAYPASDRLEWNRDADNFSVLQRADLLISDFSGVVFDFALVYDKPVLYTDPQINLDVYDAWWLNKPLWTESALPRLGMALTAENLGMLDDLIAQLLADPRFTSGRAEVREECWAYPGEAAARSVDFLLAKLAELSTPEAG